MIDSTIGISVGQPLLKIRHNEKFVEEADLKKFEFVDDVNELYHQYVSDNHI
jgi:hypothetical protein